MPNEKNNNTSIKRIIVGVLIVLIASSILGWGSYVTAGAILARMNEQQIDRNTIAIKELQTDIKQGFKDILDAINKE